MQLQESVVESNENYTSSVSFFEEKNGEVAEYIYESDTAIIHKNDQIKIIISTQFEVLHHVFDVTDIREKYQVKGPVSGRDILRTLSLEEVVDTFMSFSVMSITEIFNSYRQRVLSDRRNGELSKLDACYLYYEMRQIEDEFLGTVRADKLQVTDKAWSDLLAQSVKEVHSLGMSGGALFNDILGDGHMSYILKYIADYQNTVIRFNRIVWQPLQEKLAPISRNLKKPTLTIVK